jgi:hypothetical protein
MLRQKSTIPIYSLTLTCHSPPRRRIQKIVTVLSVFGRRAPALDGPDSALMNTDVADFWVRDRVHENEAILKIVIYLYINMLGKMGSFFIFLVCPFFGKYNSYPFLYMS